MRKHELTKAFYVCFLGRRNTRMKWNSKTLLQIGSETICGGGRSSSNRSGPEYIEKMTTHSNGGNQAEPGEMGDENRTMHSTEIEQRGVAGDGSVVSIVPPWFVGERLLCLLKTISAMA